MTEKRMPKKGQLHYGKYPPRAYVAVRGRSYASDCNQDCIVTEIKRCALATRSALGAAARLETLS